MSRSIKTFNEMSKALKKAKNLELQWNGAVMVTARLFVREAAVRLSFSTAPRFRMALCACPF